MKTLTGLAAVRTAAAPTPFTSGSGIDIGLARAAGSAPLNGSRLSRLRRQLAAMVAGMLGDDADPVPPSGDMLVPPEPQQAALEEQPSRPAEPPARERQQPAGHREPDEGFWGPAESGDSQPTSGYRSKHRLPGHKVVGHKTTPRHAAPPTQFNAFTLSRKPAAASRGAARKPFVVGRAVA
ncbi:MAG TPA: hypothetical protein VNF47_26595 [Streptosporangiaceae bacterium]|nr:hypothetical protein [Streptosporangiaceae bacterium]